MSRFTRWCFPITLALAGLFALLFLAGLCLDIPQGTGFGERLLFALFADTAMRRAFAVSAMGLALTAFVFFRQPKERPIRFTRTLDV